MTSKKEQMISKSLVHSALNVNNLSNKFLGIGIEFKY